MSSNCGFPIEVVALPQELSYFGTYFPGASALRIAEEGWKVKATPVICREPQAPVCHHTTEQLLRSEGDGLSRDHPPVWGKRGETRMLQGWVSPNMFSPTTPFQKGLCTSLLLSPWTLAHIPGPLPPKSIIRCTQCLSKRDTGETRTDFKPLFSNLISHCYYQPLSILAFATPNAPLKAALGLPRWF